MKMSLSIPLAILLGSSIIAVGLYLGLRSGEQQPADNTTTGDVNNGEQRVDAPAAPAPKPRMPRAEVQAQAIAAVEQTRPLMLEKCWEPLIKKNPEPKFTEFFFDLTFDGKTGKAIGRAINEERGKSREDVGVCLRGLPMDYVIEPPGKNTRVEFSFTLP